MNEGIKAILCAQVYDVAVRTPLHVARKLNKQLGCEVYMKREDLQPVHSFKLRGAYNKMVQLSDTERASGVIAASAGNHAQGVALAGQKLGISTLIIMPKTTPAIKVDAVRSFGAEVELHGDNYSEAAEYCKQRTSETGRTYVHPFDDPLVIAGQGTIGREIIEDLPRVTHIFVPVGGGGLIAGIAQYVKSLRQDVQIIGVEPEDSNAMQQSLAAHERVILSHVGIFADGVAVKQVGEHTYAATKRYVDEIVAVTNDQICAATKAIFEETRGIVEPAGALGVAGLQAYAMGHDMAGAVAVTINSGANMTFERLQFIAERTLLGGGKEALFAITMPERPGALQQFCVGVLNGHSISQFGYRLHERNEAHVLLGISIAGEKDKVSLEQKMAANKFDYTDLSFDDVTKEHVRHMIGGPSPHAENEHIYHVNFPERPGALVDFLRTMSDQWNISLFHYRGQGGDVGSVLIGYEASDRRALETSMTKTGYQWEPVNEAPGVRRFLV